MTPREYMDIILGVCDALALDKPVAMGCSIGGRIVLRLALEHRDRFSALIGVQAGAYSERGYETHWMHRPDVHGGEFAAGVVSGMIGPAATDANRWETLWHYMQGGPGVFKGDLVSYGSDDLRPRVGEINTAECPLYLLTGEYDYSCTPANTLELQRLIKGVEATIMKGVGHFPMSEDPRLFLMHLRPVLEDIRARAKVA
jgi:pimeloyl-ACP methyl ester carboxylesterase